MSSTIARSFLLKFLSFAIALLWVCYISMLGSELFTEIYKRPCVSIATPFVEYAFLVGCLSFVCFVVFRVQAGFSLCAKRTAPTALSQVLYIAHTLALFVCVESTAMSFTQMKALRCGQFDPSAAPFVIVSFIMLANGFVAVEQFGVVITKPEIRIRTDHESLDDDIKELTAERNNPNYQVINVVGTSVAKQEPNVIPHVD